MLLRNGVFRPHFLFKVQFMKKTSLLYLLLFVLMKPVIGIPGKLLVIGGGREEAGLEAWNGEAYKWAVEQSENKKVAVISFSSTSTWIPEHFVSDWGASEAKAFLIDSEEEANAQSTYDALMNYDVIFLKGGDQYNYYSTYNDTKTEQAIVDKFNEGGVICGTSAGLAVLGGVDFTAALGTVYPYECIEDWNNRYVKLADDFLPFLDGVIFDSHFVQRGRFPRLLGFLAKWQTNHSETLTGIGVDDKTALAIDRELNATAYGSGCVSIFYTVESSVLQQNQTHLKIDSITVTQLIDNTTIDLKNFEVSGFNKEIEPPEKNETGNYTIFASGGSDKITDNIELLTKFVNLNNKEDTILILTNNIQDLANQYEEELNSLGASNTEIFPATDVYSDNIALKRAIESADKVLIVKVLWSDFKSFFGSSNGKLLKDKLHQNGMVSAFIGDNSRFAGHTVVVNYDDPDASYDELYQYERGLDLLSTTVIIPKTFSSDFVSSYSQYENTIAAIPNAMVTDTLKYGIWLTTNNYIKYSPESGESIIRAYGTWPVMIMKNDGTYGEAVSRGMFSETSGVRSLSGFERMKLAIVDSAIPFKVGNTVETPTLLSNEDLKFKPFLNYHINSGKLRVEWHNQNYSLSMFNIQGSKVFHREKFYNNSLITVPDLQTGIYFIRLRNRNGSIYSEKMFIK